MVVLVMASVTGAGADTPSARAATAQRLLAAAANPQSDCPDTAGQPPYASGLPPLPCAPNPFNGNKTRFIDGGANFDPITQQAVVPKVTITLAPTVFRVFYVVCSTTVPAGYPPCPFPVSFPPPNPAVTPGGYYGVFADAWPQSAEGTDPQFGLFPPTTVSVMAFGSIPVQATVTIKQRIGDDGLPMPFKLNWFTSSQYIRPGQKVPGYEQYGPAPAGNKFFAPPAEVGGDVDIVLSDVTVDQVPLDVGSDCHTSTTLSLGALGGFYTSGVAPVSNVPAQDNQVPPQPNTLRYQQTGNYQPLGGFNSFLSGTVDIPAFSGCVGADGQDVSPLITGTVSGQGNPVDVTQAGSLKPFCQIARPADVGCTDHPATTYGS